MSGLQQPHVNFTYVDRKVQLPQMNLTPVSRRRCLRLALGIHSAEVHDSLTASDFAIRSQIIWAKQQFVIGRGDYHWQHEPCWYAVRKGAVGHWGGDRTQATIWQIDAPSGWRQVTEGPDAHSIHSTQKPIECMARPIRNHDIKTVYDPFCGSGTTLVACEQLGRVGYGVEIDPVYVAVTLERLVGMRLKPELM
jgi:DNA modification methylase